MNSAITIITLNVGLTTTVGLRLGFFPGVNQLANVAETAQIYQLLNGFFGCRDTAVFLATFGGL